MARMKKTVNKHIQTAQQRLAGMKAISPTLDLGEGVTVTAFETAIELPVALIARYNSVLSEADNLLNQILGSIGSMNELSARVLNGGKFRYGADSSEYEMLGGTRKSERSKPGRLNGETGNGS